MKGLLKKEWFVLIQKPMTLLLPVLLFIVMGVITKSIVTVLYLPVYAGFLPITLLTADENSRWDRFALGMPYSRKNIVSAKYLMSLMLILAGCIAAALVILFAMSGTAPAKILLYAAAASAATLIFISVLIPLNLQFGTAKARIALMVMIALVGFGTASAITRVGEGTFTLFEKIAAWNFSPALLVLLLLACALLLTAASWAVSVWIYRRKQF